MKRLLGFIAIMTVLLSMTNQVYSQCANDNTLWVDLTPASCPGTNSTSCIFGGEYCTVTVVAGNIYVFQTCGDTDFDTEITLYNQTAGTVITYNNDGCGLQSTITWTATFSGVVRVLVDRFPCASESTCMTLAVTCSPPGGNVYTHPITGLDGTYLGACMVNTCGATYYDNGGAGGSYSNNVNSIYRTFCPSQPNTCVTATINSMDIEGTAGVGCYDYLRVLNGPTQNSPDLWAGCLTTGAPFTMAGTWSTTYISTDPSGCLGFRFTSDGSVANPGWAATLSCTPCAGGPSATEDNNCNASVSVCGTTNVSGTSTGPGLTSECNGCVVAENYTNWYKITVASNGTLALTINPNNNSEDYDFALYGPGVTCGALGVPIRCSYAGITANGSTGMGNGAVDLSETVTGNGWVSTLAVTAGQTYYLMINGWSAISSGFAIDWAGSTTTFGVPAGSVTVQTNSTCSGQSQGEACAVVNSGVPPYVYSWSTGPASACLYNQPTGNYTVTVTDASLCTSIATGNIAVIPTPAAPTASGTTICQGQTATLTATAPGGTYEWYSAASGGTLLQTGASYTTPALSSTTSYYVQTTVSGCVSLRTTVTVTVTPTPSATISYAGTPFCKSVATAQAVTLTGTTGGAFSAPAGLTINTSTGAITPSTSTAGTYTVTYSIAAGGGCSAFSTTTSVTITTLPVATFSYTGTPYCSNASNPSPTYSGGGVAGAFSSTGGLVFVSTATGQVNLASSTPGSYTVTNTIAAAGGCAVVTATSPITITALPTASIAYAGTPFCSSVATAQPVTLTGTAGGTYSAPAGLTINSSTGAITPSTSTAGTYTVTYTIAAAGGCGAVSATTSVTITTLPAATISYAGSPFCKTVSTAQAVTLTGTSGGAYTASPAGLSINATTGAVTPSTSTAGTYTVTYTIAAAGGCGAVTTTASVTITTLPIATFSYTGTPYCANASNPFPTFSGGGVAGVFSSSAGLVFVSTATGQVNLATSTPGSYTVTNTIAAAGGCAIVTATSPIVITAVPSATISYAGTPFCKSVATAQAVTLTGTTGGTYTAAPAGLTINATTGAITPSSSTAGTYTVTYSIIAGGGCSAFSTTTSVTITTLPVATFSYTGTPYCANASNPLPTFSGGGVAGTFSSAPGLVFVSTATGQVNLSTSTPGAYTVTNTIAAAGGCAVVTATSPITVTVVPAATIAYAGTPFCTSVATAQPVTLTGTTGGTYTASPAGLSINASTGAITPSTSTAGSYTITYTIAAAGGCGVVTTTTSVTITALPTATISYTGNPFCKTSGAVAVNLTGTTGGTFTVAPAGLTINASTGTITPATSTAGAYTVTYTIAAASGCAVVTATASVTITALPIATFSYTGTPYCSNGTNPSPTYSGGGVAGTFSSTAGLVFVSTATGQVNLATSTPGTYTVTNTIAAAGGCAIVTATSPITITALPTATISYAGTPFCTSTATSQPVTQTGATGGVFSSTAGLIINASTGAITPSTSTAGTYTVTYTIAAANGCGVVTATTSVIVNPSPVIVSVTKTNVTICAGSDGTITINATGFAPLEYSINGGANFYSNGGLFTGLINGSYSIAVRNGYGCVTTGANVTISDGGAPATPVAGTNATYCQSAVMANLTATASAGGTLTWYSNPGLTIVIGTGASLAPFTTVGVTNYYVTETVAGCQSAPATVTITITAQPAATISYAGTPFCKTLSTQQPVTQTGTAGGTYSAPAGLTINAGSGAITPSTSTAGTYTVTYTVAAAGGCLVYTTTTSVTITSLPIATFSYTGTPYCSSGVNPSPTYSGGGVAGTFSSTAGLVFVSTATGQVNLATSTPGTYTITNTIAAAGGCAIVTATSPITITALPTATISYAGTPFCSSNSTPQAVTLTGTPGGTYSSTAGLFINSSSGAITPSTSTPGAYTVIYTIPAANGCGVVTATANVNITTLPAATINYAGSPFCSSAGPGSVTLTGTTGGAYSASPAGLSINASTGVITPGTSTAGTYTVTYTIAAASGCGIVTATTSVIITTLPAATISYTGTPFCNSNATPQSVSLVGSSGGAYSSTAGLTINSVTGAITPSTSTPGVYTVTYTIPAASGCGIVTATASVTITALPAATISYAGTPFCSNASPGNVTLTGSSGGSYAAAPAGLTINASTGTITPATSTVGTYTVTYSIAAASGCGVVTATTTVTITTLPTATISYAGTPFCSSNSTAQTVTLTGTPGGTYSVLPAGLTINSATGAITPSTSTPGAYTVTYTIAAANGCGIVTATAVVNVTTLPVATISYAGTPFCSSNSTPQAVTLTGTSGGAYSSTAGLTINPSTGAITPSSSTAGSYTVTYTIAAANGCGVVTATTNIQITTLPVATFSYTGSPYCSNASNPFPTFSGGGVAGTFSSTAGLVFVNTTSGQINISSSTPGIYTVTNTIAAANGCGVVTATSSVTITALPTANISYAGTPFCTSLSTAQPVTLVGTTGGNYTSTPAGLTINASTGGVTPSTSTAGTYTVIYTIPAASGCGVVTATSDITISTLPAATISYAGTPYCTSLSSPQSITLTGSTGGSYSSTAGLAINAFNGSVTPSASTPGTYTVTYSIPAANGCGIVTATASITITALPTATISYTGNPFCNSVASAAVTVTGTTGGTFSAPAGLTINASTGAITPISSTPGTYSVTYTIAAASGCGVVTTTFDVTINALPTATSTTPGIMCHGGNANVVVTGTGGTPSYTGTGTFSHNVGTYSFIITDAVGCTASTSITLTEPAELIASASATNILCFGGTSTITVTETGGTAPFTGDGTFTQPAGTYSYTVSDSHGCAYTTNITISQPTILAATTSNTFAGCSLSDGTATVTATGGTGAYTYAWTPIGGANAIATGLPAGNYSVVTTDANGCSITNTVSVSNSGAPVVSSTQIDVLCHGLSTGSINLTVSGGTGAYTYNWNSGAFSTEDLSSIPSGTYNYDVSDVANCHTTGSISIIEPDSLIATALSTDILCYGGTSEVTVTSIGGTGAITGTGTFTVLAGTYPYTVTDAVGCSNVTTITITQPDTLIASTTATSILCNGDTAFVTIAATGGVAPYFGVGTTPVLAGTFTYNVIDDNGCVSPTSITVTEPDAVIASSTSTAILCFGGTSDIVVSAVGGIGVYTGTGNYNVTVGTHSYIVTDANSCPDTTTIIVTEPTEITSSTTTTFAGCGLSDGSATVIALGGTGVLTYAWSPVGGANATATGLPAGNYTVEITDINGCTHSDIASVSNSGAPTTSTTQVDVLCFGLSTGSVDLTVTGGAAPYTYDWNSGAYITEDISSLAAGIYSYTVIDNANCQASGSVTITEPVVLSTVMLEPVSPSCHNSSDGQAFVQASGGTAPYTFVWSDVLNTANDTVLTLAGNTEYYVTVSDFNGCSTIDTVYITAPIPVAVSGTIANSLCGSSNGSVTTTVSGGAMPYTYLWSNGFTTPDISNLSAGTYNVTVTDDNGCTTTGTYAISSISSGNITINNVTNVQCFGTASGSISITINGGTADFIYAWSNSVVDTLTSNTYTLSNINPGNYAVTITDANDCVSDTVITVAGPSSGINSNVTVQSILCYNVNNGILLANTSGGTPPYTYLWSNSMVGSPIMNLPAGLYAVTVTDANSCTTVVTDLSITEPEEMIVTSTAIQPICGGTATGSATTVVTGGITPYVYSWSNQTTGSSITNVNAGVYIVTVTDHNTCTSSSIITITEPAPIVVTYVTETDEATHAGFIDITVLGGALPYNYLWSNNAITEDIDNLPGGWYEYVLTDGNNCQVSDSILVELDLMIPNTITPNGDSKNDDFFIINIDAYEEVTIQIYNRWGNLVYSFEGTGVEYNQQGTRFDGTYNGAKLPMGSYVYIVTVDSEKTYNGALLLKY